MTKKIRAKRIALLAPALFLGLACSFLWSPQQAAAGSCDIFKSWCAQGYTSACFTNNGVKTCGDPCTVLPKANGCPGTTAASKAPPPPAPQKK